MSTALEETVAFQIMDVKSAREDMQLCGTPSAGAQEQGNVVTGSWNTGAMHSGMEGCAPGF